MRSILIVILLIIAQLGAAQSTPVSKVFLKNGDVVTGKIVEMKVGEYVKIQALGNNILTISYEDISSIILDSSSTVAEPTADPAKQSADSKALSDFYFETYNEAVLGIGAGKLYGLPEEFGTIMNRDSYGGIYSANGVGYKKMLFAGIGLGVNGHSDSSSYSIPYMIDLRARVLPGKKFSPLVMAAAGGVYHNGGMGSFSFADGIGLSIEMKERFNLHVLFTHTYMRYIPGWSIADEAIKDMMSNVYFNYIGLRAGVSFKI